MPGVLSYSKGPTPETQSGVDTVRNILNSNDILAEHLVKGKIDGSDNMHSVRYKFNAYATRKDDDCTISSYCWIVLGINLFFFQYHLPFLT